MTLLNRRTALLGLGALSLAACGGGRGRPEVTRRPTGNPEMRFLVDRYAARYELPPDLLHRIVAEESGYNPAARNGPYYGLMQLLPQTAATMGFRGAPTELLDADTNLTYGGKYLRGAWIVGNGSRDRAITWYRKGYDYEAKRRGLLQETGLRG